MVAHPSRQGIFVGLLTLDVIYSVARLPQPNEKIVAQDDLIVAGGPATNAAIAYRHFNHSATLLAGLGGHPMARQLAADLSAQGVTLIDLTPHSTAPPPVSSILVTQGTGDRAVVSLNAQRQPVTIAAMTAAMTAATAAGSRDLEALLSRTQIVLIDGHQMAVGAAVAREAQARGIPVVVDGGSWKPGFDQVLRHTDYAICGARFRPPGCATLAESARYLRRLGVVHVAFTQGGDPIAYWQGDRYQEIAVPKIQPVDTLGAGDIFHGAFCHGLVTGSGLVADSAATALGQAAEVAAAACTHFGPRAWMAAGGFADGAANDL